MALKTSIPTLDCLTSNHLGVSCDLGQAIWNVSTSASSSVKKKIMFRLAEIQLMTTLFSPSAMGWMFIPPSPRFLGWNPNPRVTIRRYLGDEHGAIMSGLSSFHHVRMQWDVSFCNPERGTHQSQTMLVVWSELLASRTVTHSHSDPNEREKRWQRPKYPLCYEKGWKTRLWVP